MISSVTTISGRGKKVEKKLLLEKSLYSSLVFFLTASSPRCRGWGSKSLQTRKDPYLLRKKKRNQTFLLTSKETCQKQPIFLSLAQSNLLKQCVLRSTTTSPDIVLKSETIIRGNLSHPIRSCSVDTWKIFQTEFSLHAWLGRCRKHPDYEISSP